MYINDLGTREVNAYYDRKGGNRTASVNNYANIGSFASLMRQAAARRSADAVPEKDALAQTDRTHTKLHSRVTTDTSSLSGRISSAAQGAATAHARSANVKNDSDSAASALSSAQGSGNVCCEQCHQTNQLMLQMMTRNLYTQSSLGYPLTGMNAWTAYQSVAGMLGGGLFA